MKKVLGIMMLSLLFVYACGDDEDATATLNIAYDFNVDGEALEFGKTYNINGSAVSFDAANFYIGGLELRQEDGSIINLTANYLLAGLNSTVSIEGEVSKSDITEANFFIGVAPDDNAQSEMDFTSRASDDPLGIKDPSMHWNWNSGYKFLRVDGDVDTDGDDAVDTGIAYHIGSNPFRLDRRVTEKISIDKGSNTLTFSLDLNTFFQGVDLATEIDTHTGNNMPLAERLKTNMATAITLK